MIQEEPGLDLAADQCRQFFAEFREALAQKLVLPAQLVEQSLIALLSGGHLLMEGNPGLGKRTLAAALAEFTGLSFAALPCTPDMAPLEVTGSEQLREDPETGRLAYQFLPGPLFANVVYVEAIHLAPPRSLAVLVEAARSGQVVYGRTAQSLPSPFTLIASRAPGLDDTKLMLDASVTDRFLLQVSFDYPSGFDEWEIGRQAGRATGLDRHALVSDGKIAEWQNLVTRVEMPDDVLGYAWAVVRATRPGNDLAPDFVETWIQLGISPQGLTALVTAAKARALLRGRTCTTRRDVHEVALPILRHRLRMTEEARAAGLTVDRLLGTLFERVPAEGHYRPPAP